MIRLVFIILFLFIHFWIPAQISKQISFNHEGLTVNGVLTAPDTNLSYPVIIINPGTGANDRDGTIPLVGGNSTCLYPGLAGDTLRPYKGLGNALVNAGYAVLRYDKLEYTYTTPGSLGPVTFEKLWLPVKSAIDFVKTQNAVDTNNIILIGHSEGSSIIPYIAESRNDVKALISLGGPRTPFDSLLAYQLVYIADTCNGNLQQAQNQANQVLSYFDIIRSNNWNSNTPDFAGGPASTWYDYVQVVDSVSLRYNRADLPTLFIGLEEDINVPPSELDRFENEVTITNDFWLLPDLNHYLSDSLNPVVAESLTDTIIYWLDKTLNPATFVQEDHLYSISVYPNPFTDQLQFEIPREISASYIEVSIWNLKGQQKFYQKLNTQKKVFLSPELAPGIYILQVTDEQRSWKKKIIKH